MTVLKAWTLRVLRSGAAVLRRRDGTPPRLAAPYRRWASRRIGAGLVSRTISVALLSSASVALISLPLTGCAVLHLHTQKPQAPPLQTGPGQIDRQQSKEHQPPPPSTLPQPSAQNTAPPLPPVKQPKVKRQKKRKPVEAPPQETQQVVSAPPTPIGQLTTGDSKSAAANERDTMTLIRQTEQGLEGIKRALTPDERDTIVQIRTFLKQAEQALNNGDPDGARTLATKAKLLLDELTPK